MTKAIPKIIITAFILIAIIYTIKIIKLANDTHSNWVKNKEVKAAIVEIYDGYKGKPNYKKMLLSDSQTLTIPKKVLHQLKIGDSVFKQKDSNFYIIKNNKTNTTIKVKN